MKKGKPIRYICKCGCEHKSKDKLKRVRIERDTNIQVCKEHRGKLLYRLRECIDCGNDFKLDSVGPGGIRCGVCRSKERIRLTKKYNESLKRNRANVRAATADDVAKTAKWSMDPRGDFCSWMTSCIANKVLRCDGCVKFVGVFFGYDPGKKCA